MSSELFVDDDSFYRHSFEEDRFSDAFSPFSDSTIDILQKALSDPKKLVGEQQHYVEQTSQNLLSSSPPNYQLISLSLYQATDSVLENDSYLGRTIENFSALDNLEVKAEQCNGDQNAYHLYSNQAPKQISLAPHSYSGGDENVAKYMQRSYSSNFFDGKPDFVYQPCFDSIMESSSVQTQASSLSSPESNYLTCHMRRRVSSTGDLLNLTTTHNPRESLAMEEAGNFKMNKYTAEERKERILKYRAKRSQRNFNKTIKYACRKTLADNRPRIRGRFARNDEAAEIDKSSCLTREEDEDDLWIEGLNVEEDMGVRRASRRQPFANNNLDLQSSTTSSIIVEQYLRSFSGGLSFHF